MNGPMEGVRVLDLSIALTGPYAAALLADQGAEVIKVERPGVGDIARWIGVSVNGMSSLYLVCNRGKRSIAVDLQRPEGAEIVQELAAESDVVLQNFRPGVIDRLGLGYDDITTVNPDVVYASLSGFGAQGPNRDRAAYDTVIQAYGGLASSQADPADGVPVFLRQASADKVTALFASQAITAALFARAEGTRRTACGIVDDGCSGVVPVGGLGSQRGALGVGPLAALELRGGLATLSLHRRMGHRDTHIGPRLRRDVPGPRRGGLRRPTRRHHRGALQAQGCHRSGDGVVLCQRIAS